MKILIINRDYYDMFGGEYTYYLSKALTQEQVEIIVLTSNDERVMKDDEIRVLPLISRWNSFAVPRILRTIREIRPDVVSLQYVPYMYNYYGVPLYIALLNVMIRMMGFKQITTFHEIAIRFNWRKPKYWGIAIFQRLIAYTLALCSNKIIVSIEFSKEMLKPFRRKIHRIPIGSNIPPVPLSEEERARLRTKIAPCGEIIIATFGAGAAWRRTDLLLQAVGQFMKVSGQSVKVLILGSQGNVANKSYHTLKQLINQLGLEKSVYLTGYLEGTEVFKHLSVAYLFILLDSDAYGGVSTKSSSLAAGYAAGLPIIGNKGLLTDNLLRHSENIYLIDSLEIGEIVQAIASLIDNQSLRQRLIEGSIKTYQDCLTWERIAKKHREILDAIETA